MRGHVFKVALGLPEVCSYVRVCTCLCDCMCVCVCLCTCVCARARARSSGQACASACICDVARREHAVIITSPCPFAITNITRLH